MPEVFLRVVSFLTGYALSTVVFMWWCKRYIRRRSQEARERLAREVSKERMLIGSVENRVRDWRQKWTPERWGMPSEAVAELNEILGERNTH